MKIKDTTFINSDRYTTFGNFDNCEHIARIETGSGIWSLDYDKAEDDYFITRCKALNDGELTTLSYFRCGSYDYGMGFLEGLKTEQRHHCWGE